MYEQVHPAGSMFFPVFKIFMAQLKHLRIVQQRILEAVNGKS